MGSQLQLAWRELLYLLLLQTRCSYSCFCSKALSRRREGPVVEISRAAQVQAVGLPYQLSHIQGGRTTYHSMLTTPSRVLSLAPTGFMCQNTGLLTTINLSPFSSTSMDGLNTQPATRKMGTTSLPLLTRMSLVGSWSSHQRACPMSEILPTDMVGAAGMYHNLKDPWETSAKQTGITGRARCATTRAPRAIPRAPASGPPAMMTSHTHSLC